MKTTINEESCFRRYWDLCIFALIFVGCIMIPYQVVFQGKAFGPGAVLIYTIDLFFVLDIGFNFRTSFRKRGVVVDDAAKISAHYLRTYFPVDLIAVFPFELLLLTSPGLTWWGLPAILLMRMTRLLRFVRVFVIFRRWERTGWINPSYLRITKFLGIMAVLIHWLACVWFQTAAAARFPSESWAVHAGIVDADVATQYIRSLYWTITTMTTVGFGDILPMRNAEYIVAMIIMLLGASMYAFIIGNVASILSQLDSGKVSHWRRMESVTEYLRSQHVPKHLVSRVREYYEYLWDRHRGMPGHRLMEDLPESLRLELLRNLAQDLLIHVPLFKYCPEPLKDALLMELKQTVYNPGSHVVNEGEEGRAIFFIYHGAVEILENGECVDHLHGGDYFGHMSLILKEKRTATVVASSYCEMFMLPKEAYERLGSKFPELREAMKKMSSEASEKLATLLMSGVVL